MSLHNLSLDIETLLNGYRSAEFSPAAVIEEVLERLASAPERCVWITRLSEEQIRPYVEGLQGKTPDELPLYGIPFAIKDNIDLAGVPTTAGCAEYAYTPGESAFVVQCLVDAGAIPVGKTNLDQFATGLVGTRSPYGECKNSFNEDYISGGSSSGSAVAVASGLVSFSLGTDTAGSGRVPAAFNNIVGIKPTRGLLSNRGVVPACRSLDCVSVFALTSHDAQKVMQVCTVFDAQGDPYARKAPLSSPAFNTGRFRVGVPRADQLQFFENRQAQALFDKAVAHLQEIGGEAVEIDFEPFLAAARLLYEGPWVSERYAAIEDFIRERPQALFPVTRDIIEPGSSLLAVDAFKAQYRLVEYQRQSLSTWEQVDLIVTPTAGTIYTIEAVNADPVGLNSNLGYYTNFMNLLDLSAIAVPAGFQDDGLPFGVTLFAPAFADAPLAALGDRLHRTGSGTAGATGRHLPQAVVLDNLNGIVPIAVCGAHMSGLPLNTQLTERGAWLMRSTQTAATYKLFALPGGPPLRPGLVRSAGGAGIEVEVWAMPGDRVGSFLASIPAPLGLGRVELADGTWVNGFICEPCGVDSAEEVTAFGGWRAYLASRK